jgi:hypothetical protein
MADSLIISNSIELLGGGVLSANPLCLNSSFRLQQGFDLSAPQPTTDFVASLILDGERPFGRRASNRTITLPVLIIGTSRANLAAAREVLEQTIDQDVWTLTWTRDPGPGGTPLPLVIDCFRAQPSKPTYSTLIEKELNMASIVLTIPALPYGRSNQQVQPAFTSPAPVTAAPPPPPSPVVLDNYSTISVPVFSQSTQCVVGPYTACWDPDSFGDPGGQVTELSYGAVFPSALNLTGMTSLQFWLGLGSRYYPFLDYQGRTAGVEVYFTLTDSSGRQLSFSRSHLKLPVSPAYPAPVFSRVTAAIPQGNSVFSYASVASYSLVIVNRQDGGLRRFSWITAYIDALTAYPSSQTASTVTRGNLYTLYGLLGTARAPMSAVFQQPPVAGTPTTITAAGVGNYTVPANTAWLKVEAVGGGGAGATQTVSGDGGGGGGAEYARENVFPAAPGQSIPYNVGAGGTPGASPVNGQATVFGPGPSGSMVVTANGGLSAAENSVTGALGGSGSTNSVEWPGGQGRTASGSVGGGGGSSGGNSGAGQSPVGTAAVPFGTVGAGTWLCPAGVTQVFVQCWGGGGSGASGGSGGNGGGGGGSEFAAGYVNVTPGNTYNLWVGAGGAATSSTDHNGNAGASSWFTGDSSVTITASGGSAGLFEIWTGGSGAGGSGSSAPVNYNGGPGGSAYPYSGGGGSSAGTGSAGNSGNGYGTPGSAPSGGGAGGSGSGASGSAGSAGSAPGGGGGGTYSSAVSGAGAAGQVLLTYPGGAPTNNGAAAVAGGGAGGAGGGSANTAGTAGSQPGGGGGGADSAGTTEAGGAGGAGQLVITPYASPPFKNLIVHRPPLGSLKTFQPLVSVGGGGDAPDGTHEYRMPQPLTGLNASFGGTYTVYLVASSFSGSGSRTVTVSVNQYEYAGGPKYTVTTLPVTFTPSQITNGLVTAGVLTLPVKLVPPDNTDGYYTVTPQDSNTGDRYYDCIFLDTMGQTIVVNEPSTGYITYYVDEPQPNLSLCNVLGSQLGRPAAISVLDQSIVSGGVLALEPADGDNALFAYSADTAAPNIAVSYYARYFFDRFE